jgi:hypothetical protein
MGEHSAETKPQRSDLLQALSLSHTQRDRTVLQQDQECRRVATRYDKLAANYLAFVKLASIRIWLRANESTPSSLCAIIDGIGRRYGRLLLKTPGAAAADRPADGARG